MNEKRHVFDEPRNIKRLLRVFFTLCAVLFALDLLQTAGILGFKEHVHYDVENWIGFYGIYGFVGCVLLVLTAKVLRKIVMRREDYYDR